MRFSNLFKINQVERNKFCTNIINSSAPTSDFYFLVILSTIIVALGLLADNAVLVIGGMLVTPLLSPLLAIALGILISERRVILRSVRIFFFSFLFAFLTAFVIGLISDSSIANISFIKYFQPSLLTLLVAVVAGIAASYTWIKPELNDRLAGVAVTVTLIPPLTAIGLALSEGQWIIFRDSLNVLFLNIFGIIISSLLVFALMDFYKAKKRVVEEVKEEEKERRKEKKGVN